MRVDIREAGYRRGKAVLRGVSFTLSGGELLLVLGPSGSGKSTLILAVTGVLSNLLNGYVEGSVDLFGVDPLAPQGFSEVPRLVGVVLQDPEKQLVMPTPVDEVLFTMENLGLPGGREAALKALEAVGLGGKADTPIEHLSGGEKKRLCLAASLVHDPKLVILDEPTANLDPWGVSEVVRQVARLKSSGRAVVVTEHKARFFLPYADKVLVIDRSGRAVHFDSEELRRSPELLESYGVDARTPPAGSAAAAAPRGDTVLSVEGVWFRYEPRGGYVLRGVSLSLGSGEVGVVVGPNGSGKTTLLKVVAGFYRRERGSVKLLGREVAGPSREAFYVPQEPDYVFVHGRVADELKVRGRAPEEVLASAPWLRDVLGESPYKLSHGQRRWLAYTIATLYDPALLLLDEPTAGMDLSLLKQFVEWVRGAARRGKAVLIATHDVRVLREFASRAFIMEEGRLREVRVEDAVRYLEEPVGEVVAVDRG